MLIKYIGTRPCVSITCSGRVILYFGKENNHIVDITDEKIASEVLSSPLHKFQVVLGTSVPVHTEVKPAPAMKIELPKPEKPKKKKEKK